ncbi:ABC transporter permease [Phytoactinopolyspora limicola]|uniref:ABC transporter permease n=1 Tax=Phytoactinopolyspora limicola TaxID=2715536 RepID=UPI001409077E|nr:ABC transporter permease [Phytoactinopolyspora limicola]
MTMATWRIFRTEFVRGVAPVALVAMAGAAVVLLAAEASAWVGRWGALAEQIRVILLVLAPVAVTAGAWQGGREHRRRMPELTGTTSRPPFHAVFMAWGSTTVGVWLGLGVAWLVAVLLVAPNATYSGGSWWWTLVVSLLGLAAASAIGVCVGRLVPGRLVAPIAGVLMFVVGGVATGRSDGLSWVVPAMGYQSRGLSSLDTGFQLLQMGWFAALAATALVLAGAIRTSLAVVPAVLAAVVAVPIMTGPGDERWQPDPAARALVCAGERGAEVCLTRVNAFLMDEAAPRVQALLKRWDDVPGGFERAVDSSALSSDEWLIEPDGQTGRRTAVLDITGGLMTWDGGLIPEDDPGITIETVFGWNLPGVLIQSCETAGRFDDVPLEIWAVGTVAEEWAGGNPDVGTVRVSDVGPGEQPSSAETGPGPEASAAQHLAALPEAEQKVWMGRYLEAASICDADTLLALGGELQ